MFDQRLTVRAPQVGRGRFSTGCFATMTAVAALMTAQRPALAGPTGGTVVDGSAGISQSGSVTNITQSSSKAIINWQGFSIGAKETVNFNQPGSSSVTLNRVIGNETSVISGALNANGQVFIVNSAGVLFGKGAQVNVGGLVASTLDITNANFMAGNYSFSGNSSASIVNQGRIRAHGGGYVALLGRTVSNDGMISATLGTVAMASGNKITLNFGGNSLVDVTIDEGTLNALVENKRAIRADGGQVIMTAKAADAVLSAQVNNSGVIQARTMAALTGGSGRQRAEKTGSIKLFADGGTTNVSGKLDASAPKGGDGGTIETSGNKVKVADSAVITTKASSGKSGTWLIDPDGYTIAASGGDTTGAALSARLASNGTVIIASTDGQGTDGNINVNDAVSWSTDSTLTLNATNKINIKSDITAASGGLTLNAVNQITAPAAVNVGTFILASGAWSQKGTLSGFSANDFRISGGSFLRVAGGDGSGANPYQIADVYGLQGIGSSATLLGNSFALANDIDASGTATWNSNGAATPVYAGFNPIGKPTPSGSTINTTFAGVFDGSNHVISGLTINNTNNTAHIGLFGDAGASSTIRNIGVVNANITAPSGFAGGLAGEGHGTVSNAYVRDSVITGGGVVVGGLIGFNFGIVKNSYVTRVTVSGTGFVGGLIGDSSTGGAVENVYATDVKVSGSANVGGLVGLNGGSLTGAYATGIVTTSASASSALGIGGLVGTNSGSITNSHAGISGVVMVNVTNANGVGGLVGSNSISSSISNTYADGDVTAVDSYAVGGLVGRNTGTLLTGSHATGAVTVAANTSGGTKIGGLVGDNTGAISNTSATGKVEVTGAAAGACSPSPCGIGGLIGGNAANSPISNSYATGIVDAPSSTAVGGLIGSSGGSDITGSYATGKVTGRQFVGGLVGANYGNSNATHSGGTISNSYATGDVTATDPTAGYAGGLVGKNGNGAGGITTITNSYARGNVSGSSYVGGLVGSNEIGGAINSSQAYGNVTVTAPNGLGGGLAGFNFASTITNSSAFGDVNGVGGNLGALVGVNGGSIDGSLATGQINGGTGSLVGSDSVTNVLGRKTVGTVTRSTYHDVKAEAAAAAAALAAAAQAAAAKAAAAQAAQAAAARAAAAAQTAQAGSRAANTVASNAANSAATSPDPALSAAGTQATFSSAAAKIGDNVKIIEDSVKAEDQRALRRVADAAKSRRGHAGGSGAGLGAAIRSIDVDGHRFDLQGGSKKDAPGQKP
jgi:filamentous hemagglutinin family protein